MLNSSALVGAIPYPDEMFPCSTEDVRVVVSLNDSVLWDKILLGFKALNIQFSDAATHRVYNDDKQYSSALGVGRDWLKSTEKEDLIVSCLVSNFRRGVVGQSGQLINVSDIANRPNVWYERAKDADAKVIVTNGEVDWDITSEDFEGADYMTVLSSNAARHLDKVYAVEADIVEGMLEAGARKLSDYWPLEIGLLIQRQYAQEILPTLNQEHFLFPNIRSELGLC